MPTATAAFNVVGASRSIGEAGARLGRLDANDAPIIGPRDHQRRFCPVQTRLDGGELRFGLRDVGRRDLTGVKAIVRVFERALENPDIVLLHLEIGAVARYIHVSGCGGEQHRFFHHPQRLARRGHLALSFTHLIGGLLAVEQCLSGIDADGARRGDALDAVGDAIG
jgi:hypothetical protein